MPVRFAGLRDALQDSRDGSMARHDFRVAFGRGRFQDRDSPPASFLGLLPLAARGKDRCQSELGRTGQRVVGADPAKPEPEGAAGRTFRR